MSSNRSDVTDDSPVCELGVRNAASAFLILFGKLGVQMIVSADAVQKSKCITHIQESTTTGSSRLLTTTTSKGRTGLEALLRCSAFDPLKPENPARAPATTFTMAAQST